MKSQSRGYDDYDENFENKWNLNLDVDGPGCIYFLSKRIPDNFDMRGDVDQHPLAQPTLESTQTRTEKALSRPPQTLEELSRPP